MENKANKFPAYLVPLLTIPLVPLMVALSHINLRGGYTHQTSVIRTEAEQREEHLEYLEDALNKFRINYQSFTKLMDFERTLPEEYDSWEVSVDVNTNWFNRGRQVAVDLSEDGLGKRVQIDLSEQDAYELIGRYKRTK